MDAKAWLLQRSVALHTKNQNIASVTILDRLEQHTVPSAGLNSCDINKEVFLIIKPTRCTNFSNLFWNETLHASDNYFIHHQEFFTAHTATVYVIQVC